MISRIRAAWQRFAEKRPGVAQFLVFFILSNSITALQLALMPIMRRIFERTALVDTAFQMWPVGTNRDGSVYYIFDFAAGSLPDGGGGLAFFLAVQITLLVAQVINFFAQRNITFKSNTSIVKAAIWYAIAYVAITIIAAAALGLYQSPIYTLFIDTWGLGALGETMADVVVMLINAAISFWVFFPIFKLIFKRQPEEDEVADLPVGAESALSAGVATGLAVPTPDLAVPATDLAPNTAAPAVSAGSAAVPTDRTPVGV